MLGFNVFAADTDDEARFLATSDAQAFANLRAGRPSQLPPPSKDWERDPSEPARPLRAHARARSSARRPRCARSCSAFVARTGADELMVISHIYDHAARLRSYEIAAPGAMRGQ